jgi:hypothetical protein
MIFLLLTVHGNELNGSTGVIESPLYPNPSTLLGTFTWRIIVNESRSIEITFDDFDFEPPSGGGEQEDCVTGGFTGLTVRHSKRTFF